MILAENGLLKPGDLWKILDCQRTIWDGLGRQEWEKHAKIRNNKTTIFRILPVQFQPETRLLGKQPQGLAEDEEEKYTGVQEEVPEGIGQGSGDFYEG